MQASLRLSCCVIVGLAGGCSTGAGPDVLEIDSSAYGAAFDAAIEAARRDGMPPALRDRRSGVIETEPRYAASILEPWRTDNASFGKVMENTLAYQRRRARFEFTASGDQPALPAGEPDLLATRTTRVDLTRHDGTLELRVLVFVERSYLPGGRRDTWTAAMSSRARIVSPSSGTETQAFWTPVSRDVAYEHRLLAEVRRALEQ